MNDWELRHSSCIIAVRAILSKFQERLIHVIAYVQTTFLHSIKAIFDLTVRLGMTIYSVFEVARRNKKQATRLTRTWTKFQ